MFELLSSLPMKGLETKPEMTGRAKVDDTIIMTLASLMGWDGETRRLITCAVNGSLHTVAPPAKAIINTTGVGANDDITFADIPTTEVMILANPANTGDVWVNISAAAAVDTGWPLDAGDIIILSVNNLKDLQMQIITAGDKTIIIQTV